MVSMIRNENSGDTNHPQTGGRTGVIGILLIIVTIIIVVAALILAGLNAARLGWTAFLMLSGIAIAGVLGTLSQLSERRASAEILSQSHMGEDIYLDAFMNGAEPSLLMKNGKPHKANAAYMQLAHAVMAIGVSQAPPSVDRIFSAGGKETASAIFRLHHMREDKVSSEEYIDMIDDTGALRRFRVSVAALGEMQLWQISDVTDKTQGQASTLVSAPVGLCSIDEAGNVLATNKVLDRWIAAENGVRPRRLREFVQDSASVLDGEHIVDRIIRSDTRLITQKGMVTPIIMTGTWQKLNNGDMVASLALYGHSSIGMSMSGARQPASPANANHAIDADVSDRQAGNIAALAAHTENLPGQETSSHAPIAILTLSGEILSQSLIRKANPAFEDMSQGLFWRDTAFSEIFDADSVGEEAMLAASVAGTPFDGRLSGENKTPVSVYISEDPENSLRRWAYLVDISERKSLEDQLLQSQKMQAIGQLAAGVAHDFNNLLTTIRLNTDELLGRHPVGDPSYRELHDINTTVNRAAALVKKLLAFSRKQTLRMELLNITDTLSDLSVPLRQSLGERIKLNVVHGRNLPAIRSDKSQLDTVLLNLCVNARDAMEGQGGGQINITTSAVTREVLERMGIQDIKGTDFVLLAFSDTGTGMTDDVKSKIFEPFFTTKEQGKGTGLGLATVYGIIQQSGGYLSVESELGKGTTFNIFLPVATKTEEEKIKPVVNVKLVPKPVDLTGQGNILFVEDEVSVRTIAAKTLRKRGYNVVEAGDGEEAFEILEDAEDPFDLMISDVVMPSMDGPTLLRKGRPLLGDARIVFISGYAEEEFSELLSEEPDVTFLPKPFTLSQLAEKVKAEIGVSHGELNG